MRVLWVVGGTFSALGGWDKFLWRQGQTGKCLFIQEAEHMVSAVSDSQSL